MEAIKKKLLERKAAIEKSLKDNYNNMVNIDKSNSGDEADLEFAATLENIQASLHINELEEYNKILNALTMIENNTYGICIECSNPIAIKRLTIYPNTTRCIECQQGFEKSR